MIFCTESEGPTRAALCAACYARARAEVGKPLDLVPFCAGCAEGLDRVPRASLRRAAKVATGARWLFEGLTGG